MIKPKFLKGIPLDTKTVAYMKKHMGSWNKLEPIQGAMTEHEAGVGLILEVNGQQRTHMMERLMRAFIRERRKSEEHQLRQTCVEVMEDRQDA